MPDREESTPTPIPQVDPAHWEEHEGFRETFLLHFTGQEANGTLRRFAQILWELVLEASRNWPQHPESTTRLELRAALGDLRHLEGFLGAVGQEHSVSSLAAEERGLSRFAGKQAVKVRKIADVIERELAQSQAGNPTE
jgi:hypothetical protein